MLVAIPVRNPEPGNPEIRQMGADVFRHPAQVLGNDFRALRCLVNGPQPDIPVIAVGGLVFDRVIRAEKPAGKATSVDLRRLFVTQADELMIALRPPWKRIDPIETENVIQPENLEECGSASKCVCATR